MTRLSHHEIADDQASFAEADTHLEHAHTSLARNNPVAALPHFQSAYSADARQSMLEDVFLNGTYLAIAKQNPFVVADYFLFVAERTRDEALKLAAVDSAIEAIERAAIGNKCELIDHTRVARAALRVFTHTPMEADGVLKRIRSSAIWNQQVNKLLAEDDTAGTHLAEALLASVQGDVAHDPLAKALVAGTAKHIYGTAPICGRPANVRNTPATVQTARSRLH